MHTAERMRRNGVGAEILRHTIAYRPERIYSMAGASSRTR
jgi:hypothetical protein